MMHNKHFLLLTFSITVQPFCTMSVSEFCGRMLSSSSYRIEFEIYMILRVAGVNIRCKTIEYSYCVNRMTENLPYTKWVYQKLNSMRIS